MQVEYTTAVGPEQPDSGCLKLSAVAGACQADGVGVPTAAPAALKWREIAGAPPPSNTGVRDTQDAQRALIDWVGCTYKDHSLPDILAFWGGEQEWLQVRGAHGYRACMLRGNVRVFFDGEEGMGVHVEASGQGCRQLEAEGLVSDWREWFSWNLKAGASFSRVDIACDDLLEVLPFAEMERKVKADEVTRRSAKWRSFECGSRNSEAVGRTLMLGSGQSDTQLRIYDKAAEQAQKGKSQVGEWVRVEAQLRNERAQLVAQELSNHGPAAIAGILAGLVEFKEPGPDTNKARWKRSEWWAEFLASVEAIRLHLSPEERTLETVARWVVRQVQPSLALLALAPDYGWEWLEKCLGEGAERLRDWQLQLLRGGCPDGVGLC